MPTVGGVLQSGFLRDLSVHWRLSANQQHTQRSKSAVDAVDKERRCLTRITLPIKSTGCVVLLLQEDRLGRHACLDSLRRVSLIKVGDISKYYLIIIIVCLSARRQCSAVALAELRRKKR